ncbi:hypothetical protein HGRIS_013337 [Hohenbuehelia grisea]|uniref:AN1-type domain-containing protein n=1 Tax=Hohenbuehelia grisea TaxID=104357 RepID=A0ABR3IVF4_9AGAR
MDLPQIGRHCSLETCNELDFLPILCHCDAYFCRHHIDPETHSCQAKTPKPLSVNAEKRPKCPVESCNKPSLESAVKDAGGIRAVCEFCDKSFCAVHRHPKSHSCVQHLNPPPQELKNSVAQALLAKNFPQSNHPRQAVHAPKLPKDPTKLAKFKAVQLMKLRHSAIPPSSAYTPGNTPVTERVHILVSVDTISTKRQEKAFWLPKTIITGKALDQLAVYFSVPRDQSLQLSALDPNSNELRVLRNDQDLSSQVENGSSVVLGAAGI